MSFSGGRPISKLTLNTVTSGYQSTETLKENFDAIVAAIDNTVSRDGTSPNTIEADIDFNGNRILNLPEPVNGNEAARLADVLAVAPGTGVHAWMVTPSSANLRAALTDETGTGAAVFATAPALSNPTITGGSFTGGTDIAVADGGTGASTAAGARANLVAETLQTFDTRSDASAATIDVSISRIRVNSYSTSTPVCPAVYKEVTDTGTLEAWQFRSNGNTRRWQLAEAEPVDVMFGVVTGGTTDDAAATNTFLGYVSARGGTAIMYPGLRKFGSQVTLSRTVANNLEIKAHGVSIKTTQGQAISGFKVTGKYPPFATVIRGLTVEDNNTTATAGFEQTETNYVSWPDCKCTTNGDSTSSTYPGWWLHQSNPADPDTGCFWNDFKGAAVRRTGTTYLPNAVVLQGACNATTFRGFSMGGVVDGIVIKCESGQTYMSNGVSVEGVWIEGVTGKAVRVIGSAGNQMGGGLVVGGNRLESIATVLSLEGCTISAYSIPVFYQHGDIAASVTTLINNPNSLNLVVNIADSVAVQRNLSINSRGHDFRATSASQDVVRVLAANTGSGLSFMNGDASSTYLTERYEASGVFNIAANYDSNIGLMLSSLRGLSAKNQRAANFSGVKVLTGATTTVTLDYAEANSSYAVVATVLGTPHVVGFDNRTTTTFDLIGTSGDIVIWMLWRY